MRRILLAAVPAALAASAVPALPCSILAPVPGAPITSDVAFAGTVTGDTGGSPGAEPRTFTLRVDAVLRGDVGGTVEVRTAGSSAACGVELAGGKRYLVFADRGDGGTLTTSLASGGRELGPRDTVDTDDLYVPDPPGFDAARSNLTTRAFVAFAPFRAYWLGGVSSWGGLRTIRFDDGRTVATYRDGRAAPLRIVTRRVCPVASPAGVPPLTGVRRIRGVPAGFRSGGVSLFTGDVEVRITGGGGARARLRAAGQISTGAAPAFATTLARPVAGPLRRLAPCGA